MAQDPYQTPLKKAKLNSEETKDPTFTDLCKAYVRHKEGEKFITISKTLGKSTSIVRDAILKASSTKSFEPQHQKKRKKKEIF